MDPMLDYYKPNQLNVLNFKKFDLGPIAPEFGQMRVGLISFFLYIF